ncbi:MAG: hypothetical protein HWD61_13740 [Parachlamydiaceae bacterium]|nr:MAG: hypothetical protein HWD61_13740 [Parachlamydiaceae bacterium]
MSVHYKWKQIQSISPRPVEIDKIQQIQEQNFRQGTSMMQRCNEDNQSPLTNDLIKRLPLVETKGFPNAGCTCFIAASLQCLKI